jgi:ABC-2 type transport system ATP-binding protein
MQINVSEITGGETGDRIVFEEGAVTVIQMPYEYLKNLEEVVVKNEVNIIKSEIPVHKRHNTLDHVRFYKGWYNRDFNIEDILKQYGLEKDRKLNLSRATGEIIQRLAYVHAVLAEQKYALFIEPFFQATKENIHLFHKLLEQMLAQGKAVVVAVTKTEDAFLVQPDILKLTKSGLHEVETEDTAPEESDSTLSKIKVKADDKTLFVNIGDIEYLESNEGKVFINISREKFVMESTLQEAEKKLAPNGFYRCHRSYIVNLHKVKEIITWSKNTYSVVVSNSEESKIPLSRAKYNEIQERLITL